MANDNLLSEIKRLVDNVNNVFDENKRCLHEFLDMFKKLLDSTSKDQDISQQPRHLPVDETLDSLIRAVEEFVRKLNKFLYYPVNLLLGNTETYFSIEWIITAASNFTIIITNVSSTELDNRTERNLRKRRLSVASDADNGEKSDGAKRRHLSNTKVQPTISTTLQDCTSETFNRPSESSSSPAETPGNKVDVYEEGTAVPRSRRENTGVGDSARATGSLCAGENAGLMQMDNNENKFFKDGQHYHFPRAQAQKEDYAGEYLAKLESHEEIHVSVRHCDAVRRILAKHRRVVITGGPGTGKKTSAWKVLGSYKLRRFKIIHAGNSSTLDKELSLLQKDEETIAIVPKLYGSSEEEAKKWVGTLKKVTEKLQENEYFRVVFCCIKHTFLKFSTQNDSLFKEEDILIDLSQNYALNESEQRRMLEKYNEYKWDGKLEASDISKITEKNFAFLPSLCSMSAEKDPRPMLLNPHNLFEQYIENFKLYDKVTYEFLALLNIKQGALDLKTLKKDDEDLNVVSKATRLREFKSVAKCLHATFIMNDEGKIEFWSETVKLAVGNVCSRDQWNC